MFFSSIYNKVFSRKVGALAISTALTATLFTVAEQSTTTQSASAETNSQSLALSITGNPYISFLPNQNTTKLSLSLEQPLSSGQQVYLFDVNEDKLFSPSMVSPNEYQYDVYFTRGTNTNFKAFVADISSFDPDLSYTALTNVSSASNPVNVTRTSWALGLQGEYTSSNYLRMTFGQSQLPYYSHDTYAVYMFSGDDNKLMTYQPPTNSPNSDFVTVNPFPAPNAEGALGTPHIYNGYVARWTGTNNLPQSPADLVDIQTESNYLTASRADWQSSLAIYFGQLQFNINKNIANTADGSYSLYIVDDATGKVLKECDPDNTPTTSYGFSTCKYSPQEGDTGYYRGYIASTFTAEDSTTHPTNSSQFYDLQLNGGKIWAPDLNEESREVYNPIPYIPQEHVSGANPSETCGQACEGDPVNTFSGEFWDNQSDIAVSTTTSLSPGFSRSYSVTRADDNGVLGYGWTHNYNVKLSGVDANQQTVTDMTTASSITVEQENGSRVEFLKSSDGDYSAEQRVKAKLSFKDGTFSFTRDNKTFYTFDTSGKMLTINDLNNNSLTFGYNSDGSLHNVVANTGQSLTFTYDTTGRITTVTDNSGRTVQYSYDGQGNLVDIDAYGTTQHYTYDADHKVLSSTNTLGGVTTNTYDPTDRVVSQTDPRGGVTTFKYAQPGANTQLTTVTSPNGLKTVYTYDRSTQKLMSEESKDDNGQYLYTYHKYDVAGNVIETGNRDGSKNTATYDDEGKILSSTNSLGQTTSFTYNSLGDVVTIIDPANQTSTLEYDEHGNLVKVTDFSGKVISYALDANGRTLSTTSPLGNIVGADKDDYTTLYNYNTQGYLVGATDSLGHHISSTKDSLGRTVSATDTLGHDILSQFNAAGLVTKSTDPAGFDTEATYDSMGNVLTQKDQDGNISSFTYNSSGDLLTSTDAKGKTTEFTYDVMGNLLSTKDPLGNITRIDYDSFGRPLRVFDATNKLISATTYNNVGLVSTKANSGGGATTYFYDAEGNLLREVNALSGETKYTYDSLGRVSTVADAKNQMTSYEYDASNNITRVVRPDGSDLTYTYDGAGRNITSIDGAGNLSRYGYDVLGNKVSYTDPAGGVTSYAYDSAKNLVKTTNPDGSFITYGYDSRGQQVSVDYSDPATVDITRSYDARGLLTSETAGAVTTAYSYDILGNLTYRGPPNQTGGVSYTYDDNSSVKSLTYPSGLAVSYVRDANGQITDVKVDDSSIYGITYGYNGLVMSTQSKKDNNIVGKYSYNQNNQLTRLVYGKSTGDGNGVAYAGKELVYDSNQDLTQNNILFPGKTSSFGPYFDIAGGNTPAAPAGTPPNLPFTFKKVNLDSLQRLQKEGDASNNTSRTNDSVDYTFDGQSNVTSLNMNTTRFLSSNFTYNDLGQLTKKQGVNASNYHYDYSYDGRGNRTEENFLYTNDDGSVDNLPTRRYGFNAANELTSYSVPDYMSSQYSYDASGLLTTQNADKTVSTYNSEDPTNPIVNHEITSKSFAWDTNTSIPVMLEDSVNNYIYAGGYVPIAQVNKTTGQLTYLYTDNLGSVVLTSTASNGVVSVNGTEYQPYGMGSITRDLDTQWNVSRSTPFGYAGQYEDSSSGLYYMRARWYDPNTIGFISLDPLVQLTNEPYSYAAGDPLSNVDPLGLASTGLSWFQSIMTSDKLSVMDTQGFQNASTAIAGFGDSASMDVSKNVRQALGSSGIYAICEDSGYYIAGGIAGDVATLPLGGGARVGVKTVTTGVKLSKETTTVVKTVDKPNVTNFTDDTSQDTMSCLLQNSFVAGTKVLLADGTSKNIEDIKVGDEVTATDPKTGKTEGKEVTKLIRHSGEHDMVKVSLSDGQVVDSTAEHPYWSVNKQDWVDAKDLVTGDQVLTNTGEKLFVTSIKTYTADLIAYNFTVAVYHTYYVSRSQNYVLVHNVKCGDIYDRRPRLRKAVRDEVKKRAPKTADGKHYIDPNDNSVLIPINGPFHYGHRPGFEWWRTQEKARKEGWTRQELLDYENNPDHFQIEDPSLNMSHRFEKK